MSKHACSKDKEVKQVLPQKVNPRTHWQCRQCSHVFTRIKPHRKRKEYYKSCPECGEPIPRSIAL